MPLHPQKSIVRIMLDVPAAQARAILELANDPPPPSSSSWAGYDVNHVRGFDALRKATEDAIGTAEHAARLTDAAALRKSA